MPLAPILRVSLAPPRCYVFGRRVHHGLVGLALVAHDVHDWRVWVRDLAKHPRAR